MELSKRNTILLVSTGALNELSVEVDLTTKEAINLCLSSSNMVSSPTCALSC